MLYNFGFVAETNSCNIFYSKNGILYTPSADACLPGITRKKVIDIALLNSILLIEKNISLTEIYNADEVFTTGTMGELVLVNEVDGRKIINRSGEKMTSILFSVFKKMTNTEGEPLPF